MACREQARPRASSAVSDTAARRRRLRRRPDALTDWAESFVTTSHGVGIGLDSQRQRERIYVATLRAIEDGLVVGRGRHGVVVALTNDEHDPMFKLAVKIIHKVFTPSKGREPSFHRSVSHTLHLQNEVAAMAKLSTRSTFVLQLYCAMQDDQYVYLVMERACCSLKQLIQCAMQ